MDLTFNSGDVRKETSTYTSRKMRWIERSNNENDNSVKENRTLKSWAEITAFSHKIES